MRRRRSHVSWIAALVPTVAGMSCAASQELDSVSRALDVPAERVAPPAPRLEAPAQPVEAGAPQVDAPNAAAPARDLAAPGEPHRSRRPTVGLALSGGGARGGAHIGVLKGLDELRVPIDYLAGTSIGAVVGGFFVTGMTPADLEEFVESIEWEAAFLNVTPRPLRSFRRKRDDDLFLVDQKPGLNHGEFVLPLGFMHGQVIDMILSRVTFPASRVDDFDELAVPFRAVTANLATGEAVVLGEGSLARALRASMSIPALLSPIEIDGALLVDGGIAMNLPVEAVRDMGAERVIAVDITTPLLERETLRSVLDVTNQLTGLLVRAGIQEQRDKLGPDDVVLTPRFDDSLSSLTFARMKDAIQSGYDIVMANRERLAELALSESEYAAHVAARTVPSRESVPQVEFVTLDNNSAIADSVVDTRLSEIRLGEPLDLDAVERSINKVYGLEFYQNVRWQLVEDERGRTGLEVELDPRSWGPSYLQLGMQLAATRRTDALFGLAASYLRTEVNDLGGEWRATFVIGDEPGFALDWYQPVDSRGLFFLAPRLDLSSDLVYIFGADRASRFESERVQSESQVRSVSLEIAGGREIMTWGEWRFGLRGTRGDVKLRVGDPTLFPAEDFKRGETFGRFQVDTMDDMGFPRAGSLASVEWRGSIKSSLAADDDYDQILLSAAHAHTWGRHTVLSTVRYDSTISGVAPLHRSFRLGGLMDLSGLSNNQLIGQHAMRVGASYYRRIGDLALFPAFAGVSVELGNAWDARSDVSFGDARLGGSLWAGVNTPVGPVFVGLGRAEGGNRSFYVFLGRIF